MFTSKQASQLSGVGYSTIRHYSIEWADFLSPSATPEAGETRYFTDKDIAVFKTIKVLRDQGAETDQIRKVLEKGERYELPEPSDLPPEPSKSRQEPRTEPANALASFSAFERFVAPWESQLKAWQDRVKDLELKLEKLEKARARAENKATRAELARLKSEKSAAVELAKTQARVKQLEAILEEMKPADQPSRPWWKFWEDG